MKIKISAAAALLIICATPAYFAFQGSKESGGAPQRIPDYYKTEAEAKPFPKTLDPAQFSHRAVQRAYRAAREIPAVLAQQPCYCYCDRMGHKGLLACHRDNHSAG